jgi:hypothetical protein
MQERVPPTPTEPGVVASSVYAGGRRVADITIEEASVWRDRSGHVVWNELQEYARARMGIRIFRGARRNPGGVRWLVCLVPSASLA